MSAIVRVGGPLKVGLSALSCLALGVVIGCSSTVSKTVRTENDIKMTTKTQKQYRDQQYSFSDITTLAICPMRPILEEEIGAFELRPNLDLPPDSIRQELDLRIAKGVEERETSPVVMRVDPIVAREGTDHVVAFLRDSSDADAVLIVRVLSHSIGKGSPVKKRIAPAPPTSLFKRQVTASSWVKLSFEIYDLVSGELEWGIETESKAEAGLDWYFGEHADDDSYAPTLGSTPCFEAAIGAAIARLPL